MNFSPLIPFLASSNPIIMKPHQAFFLISGFTLLSAQKSPNILSSFPMIRPGQITVSWGTLRSRRPTWTNSRESVLSNGDRTHRLVPAVSRDLGQRSVCPRRDHRQRSIPQDLPPRKSQPEEAQLISYLDKFETLPNTGRKDTSATRAANGGKGISSMADHHGMTRGSWWGTPWRRRSQDRTIRLAPIEVVDHSMKENKPFQWYGVFLPHTPHNPPERLLKPYQNLDFPCPLPSTTPCAPGLTKPADS